MYERQDWGSRTHGPEIVIFDPLSPLATSGDHERHKVTRKRQPISSRPAVSVRLTNIKERTLTTTIREVITCP